MATNITGVTMTQPLSDPNIQTGGSFTMGGQINTAGGGGWAESGDMYFEWDQGTGSWTTIGTSGGLYHSATNPLLGLQTAVEQTITIYSDTADTYQVRVKLIEDDLTEYTTAAQTVTVSAPANAEASAESCDHLHDGESPVLTQQHTLAVAEAYHLHDAEPADVTESGAIDLVVADAYHLLDDNDGAALVLQLTDNLNDMSAYSGSSFPDWTEQWDGVVGGASTANGTAVIEVAAGGYQTSSKSKDYIAPSLKKTCRAWTGIGTLLNGEILCRFKVTNQSNNLHLYQRIQNVGNDVFMFYCNVVVESNTTYLNVGYHDHIVVDSSVGQTYWNMAERPILDEWHWLRWVIYQEDTNLVRTKAKLWRDIEPEPDAWDISTTVNTSSMPELNNAGYAGIGVFSNAASRYIDYIAVNTRAINTGINITIADELLPWLIVSNPVHDLVDEGPLTITMEAAPIDLIVAEANHDLVDDGLSLTQDHSLAVAEAYSEQVADNISLASAISLEPAEATHDLVVDPIGLVQLHDLATGPCDHLHVAANVILVQLHILAVAAGDHLQVADNISLSGAVNLEIQAADHLQLAEAAPLTQVHALGVDAGDLLHFADNISLSGAYTLENLDADHLQAAEAPTLVQTHLLTIAEAAHIQMVDPLPLTGTHDLAAAGADHLHLADNLVLTQVLPNQLNVAACDHLVASDPPVLSQLHALAVDGADHDQLADTFGLIVTLEAAGADHILADDGPLSLAMGWRLSIASAAHLHTAATMALSQAHLLTIQPDAIQLVSDHTQAIPNATMSMVFQTDYGSFTTSYSLKSLSPQFDVTKLTGRSSTSGLI